MKLQSQELMKIYKGRKVVNQISVEVEQGKIYSIQYENRRIES